MEEVEEEEREISEYERLRQAKIRRNLKRLTELGLLGGLSKIPS